MANGIFDNVIVDNSGANNGKKLTPGIQFNNGREGIASQRTAGGANLYGLDLWVNNTKALTIMNPTQYGPPTCPPFVGIGTTSPTALLHVETSGPQNTTVIFGRSTGQNFGIGVLGITENNGIAVSGTATGPGGTGVYAQAENPTGVGLAVSGVTGQIKALQQWIVNDSVFSVVDDAGNFGIGTSAPKTTLQVNGGVSAKIATKTGNYTMTPSDFAILANATSAAVKITLPSASTAGMVVHVKKVDTTTNVVTIAGAGTDKIEGAASKVLSKKYASFTLIADGTSTWYILSNAT